MIDLIKRFNKYQQTRFPIIILVVSLLPAILSSATVVIGKPTVTQVIVALITSVFYLLHIRITDEIRDFNHDNKHHKKRPIQKGIISLFELRLIDYLIILFLVLISLSTNLYFSALLIFMFLYTYSSSKDFFLEEGFRKNYLIFNSFNLVQMLLLQILTYLIYSNSSVINQMLIIHFLFTTTGTLIFELVRKIKRPGHDGTGKDTYSYYFGFSNSMYVYLILIALNGILFYSMMTILEKSFPALIISTISFIVSFIFAMYHNYAKSESSEQMMQLTFISSYSIFNLVIFI